MPCHELQFDKGKVFFCRPAIYEYDGWFFEVPHFGTPWPLNTDGEPRKTPPGRKFWDMYERFAKLTDEQKKRYEV